MANGNTIDVVGNLTRDPELKFTPSGKAMARFSVADNHGYKSGDEWQKKTSFIDCVAWGDIAEHITNSLSKGDRVIVLGRLDQQTWENEDGDKRSKLEIVVDSIGPDLRFATAQVSKADSGGGSNSGKKPSAPVYAEDEEPFRVDAGEWSPTMGFGSYPERMLG